MELFIIFNAMFSLPIFLVTLWIALTPRIHTGVLYTIGLCLISLGSIVLFASWIDGTRGVNDSVAQGFENLGLFLCVLRFVTSPKMRTLGRMSQLIDAAFHIGEIGVTKDQFEKLNKGSSLHIH